MTEHDQQIMDEWQVSCEGVTERRLRDFINALDDLRSLSHRRQGAHILKASRHELRQAMKSIDDLLDDLEGAQERPLIIHLSDLRKLNASNHRP